MNALQILEMQNVKIVEPQPHKCISCGAKYYNKICCLECGCGYPKEVEMPREELAAAQENALLDAEGDIRDFEVDGFDFT